MSSELQISSGHSHDKFVEYSLDELLTKKNQGVNTTTEKVSYSDAGVPVIRANNVLNGVIDYKDIVYVDKETFARIKEPCKPRNGDILYTNIGSQFGNAAKVDTDFEFAIAWNVMRLQPRDDIDSDFLMYLLNNPETKAYIRSLNSSSTMPFVSGQEIGKIKLKVPSIYIQRSISFILKSFDARIALLRETNATLEAIAQALFKSWFVDFDPVHANAGTQAPSLPPEIQALFPTTFTDSPQGPIPDGWSTGSLGDVAETSRKQLKPEQLSAETLYVGLEHIPRKQLGLDSWGTAEELASAKSAFERNDILFGKLRPYFHKVVVAPIDGVCSTDILVCKSKQISFHYYVALHLFSDELISYADRLSNGAKMPRINWKDLAAYEIVIPPSEIVEEFQSLVEPMINRILANVGQARTLSSLRDTLLPRLISGQLRLPDAEQAIAAITD